MCLAARYGTVVTVGRGSQTARIEGTRPHRTYLGTPGRRAGTPRRKPAPMARSIRGMRGMSGEGPGSPFGGRPGSLRCLSRSAALLIRPALGQLRHPLRELIGRGLRVAGESGCEAHEVGSQRSSGSSDIVSDVAGHVQHPRLHGGRLHGISDVQFPAHRTDPLLECVHRAPFSSGPPSHLGHLPIWASTRCARLVACNRLRRRTIHSLTTHTSLTIHNAAG